MKKSWIKVVCFCLLGMNAAAQKTGYGYYTNIDTVRKTGFYNIALSPGITAHLKTDYNDVRIVHNSQWVPHVLNTESDVMREPYLRALKYSIPENSRQHTVLLAKADAFTNGMSNLLLSLSNTAVERICSVSGSYDNEKWFVIHDSILLSPFPGIKQTSSEIRIGFPSSGYNYFRVVIFNNDHDPFNITNVSTAVPEGGIDNDKFLSVRVVQNPPVRMIQTDSGRISYIKIWQQGNYHFDRVSYSLSGTKYFNRKAEIYLPTDAGQSMAYPGKLYTSFNIVDNVSYNTKVPVTNTKEFVLLVYNDDNPPLNFTKISTSLNQRFITAYLDSNKDYQLLFGNNSATAPVYDLKVPDSATATQLPFLKTGNIIAMKHKNPTATVATVNYKWVLWVVLGIVLLALAFFSFKMIKEIDKNKTT
jgi:hypothetical protein